MEKHEYNFLYLEHFGLLIKFLRTSYTSIIKCLTAFLKNHKITYNLLLALFKPNIIVYITCFGTSKPRYVKYFFGIKRKIDNGIKYFYLKCDYIDSDYKTFGKSSIELVILKFRRILMINFRDIFPLEYHPNKIQVKANFVKYSKKFVFLTCVYYW